MQSLNLIRNVINLKLNAKLGLGGLRPILASHSVLKYQNASFMILKSLRDDDYKRPPAFPYKDKKYRLHDQLFDRVTWRFDENTKLLVVEGPPASNKTEVAKEIAEAYDLHYIPPVDNLDFHYINYYGFDNRKINDEVPSIFKSYDIHEFLENPYDPRSVHLHKIIYSKRLKDYVGLLAHILSTGQGVVTERSVYADHVFVNTFTQYGFYPKNFDRYMGKCRKSIYFELLRPHVIIYLDQSVDVTRQKIKERNFPGEKNSPVYKPEVLKTLEENYKSHLNTIGEHAEILLYDWNDERDTEIIIEDIANLNLDDYTMTHKKMRDWRTSAELTWIDRRALYTNHWDYFAANIFVLDFCCEEIYYSPQDLLDYKDALCKAPGMEYLEGYNPKYEPFPFWK